MGDQWELYNQGYIVGPMRSGTNENRVERVTRGDQWEWGHRVQTMRRGLMNWGTSRWEGTNGWTNEKGDQWEGGPMSSNNVVGDLWIGAPMREGPMRWGTNESGGPMRWGTNEMSGAWVLIGGSMRWGTNEMGYQWCAPVKYGHTRSRLHIENLKTKYRVWQAKYFTSHNTLGWNFICFYITNKTAVAVLSWFHGCILSSVCWSLVSSLGQLPYFLRNMWGFCVRLTIQA